MASRNEPKGKLEQGTDPIELPGVFGILPLRNSVLFPQTVMPISVGREKTLRLIDDAIKESKPIAVVSQKDPATDDPDPDEMYKFGTAARILKAIRIGGNNVNLIIQGVERVRLVRVAQTAPFLAAEFERLVEMKESGIEIEALSRNLTNQFQRLVAIHPNLSGELGEMVQSAEDSSRLADLISSALPIPVA